MTEQEQELSAIVNEVFDKYQLEFADDRTMSLIRTEIMNRINVSNLRGSMIIPKIRRVECKCDNVTKEMHVTFFEKDD